MRSKFIHQLFITRPLVVESDVRKHRLNVLLGFSVSFFYAIAYGIFEYFVMYTNPGFVAQGVISPYVNWSIMYSSTIIILIFANKCKIEYILLGVFFFLMFEDLIYHICYGLDNNFFPFPVYDWWDQYLPSFRVLGNLGQAVIFWPYAPLYYFPGFGLVIILYLLAFITPKGSRIINWIVLPLILGIMIGLVWNDTFALVIIILTPLVLYSYIITLLILRKKGIISLEQVQTEKELSARQEKSVENQKTELI